MPGTLYLAKANDDVVSHCRCSPADALIKSPSQMDCPWCGCGWLFVCLNCRRAFTFARAVTTSLSLEEIGRRDLEEQSGEPPSKDELDGWIDATRIMLQGVILGETYVYLDGYYLPANCEALAFDGWTARHELPRLPQAEAVVSGQVLERTLADRRYWDDRRLPD